MTILFLFIASVCFGWYPTVDGQRVQLDYITTAPYHLGLSSPPGEIVDIKSIQSGLTLFEIDGFTGTNFNLYTVTGYDPVSFYENGAYVGTIVPEPATILLLLSGIYGHQNYNRRRRNTSNRMGRK